MIAEPARAINEMHRRYAGQIYDKCRRMLGDPAEAEDAVQEVFVRAYQSIHRLDEERSPLPWLYKVATNVCLNMARTRRRKGLTLIAEPELHPDPYQPSQERRLHTRQVLSQVLEELDQRGQEILVAHYVDGMTQEEIARGIGISRRAVVKRLTRLRTRVAELLGSGGLDG